jgi:uncharacterized DUF497 family protein
MLTIAGFDWDDGNWPKCGRHGVSKADVEHVIASARFVVDDPSPTEKRLRAVGSTAAGRYVFVAFTLRQTDERTVIRPISARYMHAKEVKSYEDAMAPSDDG